MVQKQQNRDLNNFKFFIENSAISSVPLYSLGWNTYKTQVENSTEVKIIDYNDLLNKYNINFDTLVIDNEGNFVDMLKDFPNILDNIRLLIIEHDFNTDDDLHYFNEIMTNKGFRVNDAFLKEEKYGPGINWSDGLVTDPIFVSVWKR